MNLALIKNERTKKEDKEKMLDFVKSLGQITGPEVTDPECRDILESALTVIHTVTMGVKESIENI